LSSWDDIKASKATEFVSDFWDDWYERELNALSDTCMHNHSSGKHEYHLRTTAERKTLIYVCRFCLEIVAPLEHLEGDSNEQ